MNDISPIETAAIPSAVAILKALQTFKNDLGSDPTKLPLTAGPAFLKFTATVELQFPVLATQEWSAIGSQFDAKVNSWVSSLEAKLNPPVVNPPTS